uniref:Uncharacterized protein n=1 Tax=Meloidogyne enterolobii TaxID=390850 RepID=A0A6V7UCY6_MELEN|nr:unnamed protein product [Meloidogyne enterolobii]
MAARLFGLCLLSSVAKVHFEYYINYCSLESQDKKKISDSNVLLIRALHSLESSDIVTGFNLKINISTCAPKQTFNIQKRQF